MKNNELLNDSFKRMALTHFSIVGIKGMMVSYASSTSEIPKANYTNMAAFGRHLFLISKLVGPKQRQSVFAISGWKMMREKSHTLLLSIRHSSEFAKLWPAKKYPARTHSAMILEDMYITRSHLINVDCESGLTVSKRGTTPTPVLAR